RVADLAAPSVDRIAEPGNARVDARRALARTHVPERPDAALERPGLEVEAVRIGEPARALEPCGQSPALSRGERRRSARALGIPHERNAARDDGALRDRAIDVE